MSRSLPEWVDYIQTLHHRQIELSLERVREVYQRLCPAGVSFKVITLAGTNGKGSTAELLASCYLAAGYKVGKYTSPHISAFNERYRIGHEDVSDQQLLRSFESIEQNREDTKLTFFEYGTLIAIDLFVNAEIDVAIMEVGLGGRLDAVNILDPDLAIVTNISIDHTAWLGDSIEQIGREKIGIARRATPCVLGMPKPPASILEVCDELDIRPSIYGRDFGSSYQSGGSVWNWYSSERKLSEINLPLGQAGHQLQNASVALQAITVLDNILPVSDGQLLTGITNANVGGRCQIVRSKPTIVVDVAHNVDSVAGLVNFLQKLQISGKMYAVCGMLADKQIGETLIQLHGLVDEWHFASIDNERGATAIQVHDALLSASADQKAAVEKQADQKTTNMPSGADGIGETYCHSEVAIAVATVNRKLEEDDCLVVFGSFYIVGDIIDDLNKTT